MLKYVIYYRVSTKKQGDSGLGLESQQRDIRLFLESYSGVPYEVIEQVTDIKSGKGDLGARPELEQAVSLCKASGATLLVAKLDRLSRDVELIAHLIKAVDVKVACMPAADKFQLHLYAALAEQERDFISARTKAALKEAKARGKALGGYRGATKTRNGVLKERSKVEAEKYRLIIKTSLEAKKSLRAIAQDLNDHGYTTKTGKQFTQVQVKRIKDRLSL